MDLNPVLTPVRDLGEFIREQRTTAQISIRGLAAKAGVSNPYLSQVERGLRRPSAEILAQIAHGLSISVESLLAKAGILETAHAPAVVLAVRADEVLTERQKSALIDIYAAFATQTQAVLADRTIGRDVFRCNGAGFAPRRRQGLHVQLRGAQSRQRRRADAFGLDLSPLHR